MTICTPNVNATVTSPVNIVAGSTDSAGATAMAIYVDNDLVSKQNGGQIGATANLGAGMHYVVAQLWDSAGRVIKQSEYITVSAAQPPPTVSFSANPTSIASGQSSTLTWSTSNATAVSIDHGVGPQPANGSVSVSPTANTTYTLTATGPGGTANAQATVIVADSGGCNAAKPAPSVTICSPANGATVPSPVHVLAAPASNNGVIAMAVYFDNVLKYKANVNKLDTTVAAAPGPHTVVVQFWDNNGNVPAKASSGITVGGTTDPPPTVSFSATPASVTSGQSSTLSWSATNATSVTIDNGIGTQPASGSINVSPAATTTYTLTATGAGGSSTAKATVTVGATGVSCSAGAAPSVTLCAPANGSAVSNPVHILATPASNNGVIAMAVYFDNTLAYKANVQSVDTTLNTTTGAHFVVVQFWDNNGNVPAKASANITVSNTPPPVGITVSPNPATVHIDSAEQFTATSNGTNADVTWFVDDIQGGNSTAGAIDANGIYTAPGAAGSHTIRAVSTSDSTQTGSAVVNVIDPALAWTTYHFDQQRTGANTQEAILKPSNLNRFGKLASYNVDGLVYAQPLYVPDLTINGSSHNVLYVATEHDSLYAFDADGENSAPLWQKSLLGPGQTTVSGGDNLGITPEIGITSTPVIDRDKNLIYVVTYVNGSSGLEFWLHALDLVSGTEQLGGPTRVTATVSGAGADSSGGNITLEGGCWQRSGLALGNGQVYIAFGHCSHGWVLAFDQNSLNLTAAYNTTPDGAGGTIWMGGGAPAFDSSGNVYVLSGTNFGASAANGYNDAFMKFSPTLNLDDYFIPSNNDTLVANDVDLGAGAPVVLPDNGSAHPHEIVGAGKDGRIFLVDRDSMGQFDAATDHVIQSIQSGVSQWNNFHDTPAYWSGNLYYHANADVLRQFNWTNGLLSTTPAATSSVVFNAHGATPAVSANGASDAIVWELQNDAQPSGPAVLRAYDANNVANQLYSSSDNPNDTGPNAVKFTTPTVINGKVYVGGGNQVAIYGLVK